MFEILSYYAGIGIIALTMYWLLKNTALKKPLD